MSEQSTTEPVVSYLRKSTLRQEDSIPSQREQARGLAATLKVRVAREYVDEGIAGDDLDGRPGLQQLLADVRAGKVKTLIVDEFSRLSRADPITTIAEVIRPLKNARVTLLSVKDGRVSWDDLAGLLMLTIKSDQTSEEVKGLAYRILRSAKLGAARGERRGGPAAYGYRLTDKGGKKLGKKPGELVIDPEKADVVRLCFARVLAGDSIHAVCDRLNRLGYPSPRGKRWSKTGMKQMLANPVYAGHFCWGRQPQGKHWRMVNGEMVKTELAGELTPDGWEVRRDAHPAIIDQATFDAVQDVLAGRAAWRGKAVAIGGYTLSGMLVCSHCGRTLHGRLDARGKPRYECQPLTAEGERVCRHYGVREHVVLDAIAGTLRKAFTDPEWLADLRRDLEREAAEAKAPEALQAMRSQLAALDRDVTTAKRRAATAADDLAADLADEYRRLRADRDLLAAELRGAEEASAVTDFDDAVEAAVRVLDLLEVALRDADEQTVRDLLRPLIQCVELRWNTVTREGKKDRHLLAGGCVVLSTVTATSQTRSARACKPIRIPLVLPESA